MPILVRNFALGTAFGLLLWGFYRLISWLHDDKVVTHAAAALVEKTGSAEEQRSQVQRESLQREGKQKETGLALRFDRLLRRSGLRAKLPFMSAGLYLAITVIIAVLLAFAVNGFTKNVICAGGTAATIVVVAFGLLIFRANRNYKCTEQALLPFCDIVGNFAATSDDLIGILDKAQPYLNEPLRAAIGDCCAAAHLTGDTHAALQTLTENVEHEQFQLVIQNLEICSRYTCNFAEIIKDCRVLLAQYMAAKKQRAAMVKNARAEMLLLLLLCGFTTGMVSGFVETGIWPLLTSGPIGWGLLAFCAAVLLAAAIVLFSTDKGRG